MRSKLIIHIYRDVDRQYRWRFLRKAFGKTFILADSAEAYHNLKDAQSSLDHIAAAFQQSNVTVTTK